MRWRANYESHENRHYEIRYDPFAGFYLYVYQKDKCIYDHLQDTLEIASESAWEDYGVPKNSWKQVEV